MQHHSCESYYSIGQCEAEFMHDSQLYQNRTVSLQWQIVTVGWGKVFNFPSYVAVLRVQTSPPTN